MLDLLSQMFLSFIFVSHDISVVRYFCDRVAVMHRGRIVEMGAATQVCDHPEHPYTKALLSAVPRTVVPHGGHQMSLNIAAGLGLGGNESYPEVFEPFCGFADATLVEDSYVGLPDAPGIGFEERGTLYAEFRKLVGDLGR